MKIVILDNGKKKKISLASWLAKQNESLRKQVLAKLESIEKILEEESKLRL